MVSKRYLSYETVLTLQVALMQKLSNFCLGDEL